MKVYSYKSILPGSSSTNRRSVRRSVSTEDQVSLFMRGNNLEVYTFKVKHINPKATILARLQTLK